MARSEKEAVPEEEEERRGLLEPQPISQTPSLRASTSGDVTTQGSVQLKAQPSDALASATSASVSICRICLEEDTIANLEAPCKCSGTQRHAHHACIQRWVDEKGNARCEICEQQYGPPGHFTVPPAPAPMLENMPLFTPMYILEASDSRTRGGLDLYDTDSALQRNPSVSWCISFIVFFMFLVVLHHTLIVADGMDYDPSGPSGSGGTAPAPGAPMPDDDADDVASNLLLFLFWVATKAVLIGIPLYTVMRVASRQARREQYEAMMRAGNGYDGRRMVIRVRGTDQPLATAV